MSEEKAEPRVPAHEALPLPDYDHLPVGSLEHRIRTLDEAGVRDVLAYEEAHAHRLPVLELLRHRLGQLEHGAQPSGAPRWHPRRSRHPRPTPHRRSPPPRQVRR